MNDQLSHDQRTAMRQYLLHRNEVPRLIEYIELDVETQSGRYAATALTHQAGASSRLEDLVIEYRPECDVHELLDFRHWHMDSCDSPIATVPDDALGCPFRVRGQVVALTGATQAICDYAERPQDVIARHKCVVCDSESFMLEECVRGRKTQPLSILTLAAVGRERPFSQLSVIVQGVYLEIYGVFLPSAHFSSKNQARGRLPKRHLKIFQIPTTAFSPPVLTPAYGNIMSTITDNTLREIIQRASAISRMFMAHAVPRGTYTRLRLLCLLSLLSRETMLHSTSAQGRANHTSSALHLLVLLPEDDPVVARLIAQAATYFDDGRGLTHQTSMGLVPTATWDAQAPNPTIADGSLSLAADGVCLIQNVSHLRPAELDTLYQVPEITVSAQAPAAQQLRHGTALQVEVTTTIHSTVWATTDSRTVTREGPLHDRHAAMEALVPVGTTRSKAWSAQKIMQAVDLIHRPATAASASLEVDRAICAHVLDTVQAQNDERELAHADSVRSLLHTIRTVTPTRLPFDNEAQQLLQEFFAACRRVQSRGVHATEIPSRAFSTLTKLATAHCRLSLRHCVSVADALIAIMLFEEVQTVRTGYSVLQQRPLVHDPDAFQPDVKFDHSAHAKQLYRHVVEFCQAHCSSEWYHDDDAQVP
ncbi:hypothetical protein CAOG_00608 [Capsaspora owczarzaki ATCC 30864]|uniref:MCM AAA-lid domain-containing protein n=1 Tax=Capsaspora owczarzaki (strain ATCC 30864) TaxID=595528 RepID=A0A0D2WHG0_CAPO3|nr:hypothetical protein CAOG_00608 [Capsaspora owczarzaki ATCC 30864]KJE89050.1 hypothetical protein CAOG_000608 [Capsaspora owczarzaki ATCC 30864]|eukprot:XP_004365479.1 hypothetical protein CAOG_00608 [Capsaspora owczarzaki ATCC 30864]